MSSYPCPAKQTTTNITRIAYQVRIDSYEEEKRKNNDQRKIVKSDSYLVGRESQRGPTSLTAKGRIGPVL